MRRARALRAGGEDARCASRSLARCARSPARRGDVRGRSRSSSQRARYGPRWRRYCLTGWFRPPLLASWPCTSLAWYPPSNHEHQRWSCPRRHRQEGHPLAGAHASMGVQATVSRTGTARPQGTGAPPIPQRSSRPNHRSNGCIRSHSLPPPTQGSSHRPAPLLRALPFAPPLLRAAGVWTEAETGWGAGRARL